MKKLMVSILRVFLKRQLSGMKVYGTIRVSPETLGLPSRTPAGDKIKFVEISGE